MRNLERATFLAAIAGLLLLVGVLYLKVSDKADAPSLALVPSPPAGSVVPTLPAATPATGPTSTPRLSGVVVNVRRESVFTWPANGQVTSYFGPGHPNGIDIGLQEGVDSPIRAAASGTVVFTGDADRPELGLHVVVDHGESSTTYGHLSQIRVSVGQDVQQGDVVGLGGSTGDATGKHLHFELRLGDSLVDPLRYLSVGQRSAFDSGVQVFACRPGTIPIDPASTLRVSFLPTLSVDLRLDSLTLDSPPAGSGAPAISLIKDGNLAVVTVSPMPLATGITYGYTLKATLVQPGDLRQDVDCNLELTSLETLPNVIDSNDGPDGDAAGVTDENEADGEGTPQGEAETPPTEGPEAEAPPPAPRATAVPPTATPGPPKPLAVATATPGAPRGGAFPTATSSAPKPAAFPTATSAAPKPAYVPTKAATTTP